MSSGLAARIRAAPAVVVLDSGVENINRVVETKEFGLVVDRQRKPPRNSPLFAVPTFMPQPFFEHDVLRRLNAAGASFVQAIHYADDKGMILEYAEGRPPTVAEWDTDAQLRREYSRHFAKTMGELAAISDAATPHVITPAEHGIWPVRLGSTTQYGRLMRDRTVQVWNRVAQGWTTRLLDELGGTGSVAEELAGFELTGDRPMMLLHNDLHMRNTVRPPFKVIDWTNASPGDPLWAATQLHLKFPVGQERDRFMADLRAELPSEMFRGFEHDWEQHQVLERQRTRTVSGGMISQNAKLALGAASRVDTPEAIREVVRPYAQTIHTWSNRFADDPRTRTVDETTDLVMDHIGRQLDPPTGRSVVGGARRSRTRDHPRTPPGRAGDASRTAEISPKPRVTASETTFNNASPVPRLPGPNMHLVGAGFAPVRTKLPTAAASAGLPPGGAVNHGPGRVPSRDTRGELSASPARGTSRSLQPNP